MSRIVELAGILHDKLSLGDMSLGRREADFDPCTGQPAHQQTRMSEDTVLDRRKGMLDGGST